jgi:uroporphyrinogen decarboxylase
MRQAGRYMPEYRALREKHTLLQLIAEPELAARVTLQPLDRFDFDAAILFNDLLPPLDAMGLGLEFVAGEGPRILRPLKTTRDVDMMAVPAAEETLGHTMAAIRLLRPELDRRGIPLIGFGGAPFTMAAYALEGEGSRGYDKARTFMLSEPAAWERLMKKITAFQADYLTAQAKAGAQALQVFDSWVGVLGRDEYRRFVAPYNKTLFTTLKKTGVPVIHFTTRTSAYLEDVAADGADVLGVDAQLPLGEVRGRLGWGRPVQGNLEPLALLAPWHELKYRVDEVLEGNAGRPGHIFNVGHGLVPSTPVDAVARLVDYVHQRTAGGAR